MPRKAQSGIRAARLCHWSFAGAAVLAFALCAAQARAQAEPDDMGDPHSEYSQYSEHSQYQSESESFTPESMLGPGEEPAPVSGPPGMFGAFTEANSPGATFYFSPENLFGAPQAQSRAAPKSPETLLESGPVGIVPPQSRKEFQDPYGPGQQPAGPGEP